MKLQNFSIIAGGIIILLTSIVAFVFVLHAPSSTKVETPETDVEVAISDDLSIKSEILNFVDEGNGTFLIKYQYTITHVGNYPALNLVANSWFNDTAQNTFQVIDMTTNSTLTLNPNFDGKTDRNILVGNNSLPASSSAQIVLTVRLTYADVARQFVNFVEITGNAGAASSSSSQSVSLSSSSSVSSTSSSVSTTITTTTTSLPSTSSSTGTTSTFTRPTSLPSISTPAPAPGPSSTPRSSSSSRPSSSSSIGIGGGSNSLYDTDQVAFPFSFSGQSQSTTTSSAPVGKGL